MPIRNGIEKKRINEPARVPAAAARLRPFFFKIKLVPINKLDDTARINPLALSEIAILFYLLLTSSAINIQNRGSV